MPSSSPRGVDEARARPRVLVVGAGAVGQSYGHCLSRGGAAVTYLVKPKHAAGVREGLTVYPLNRRAGRRRRPQRLEGVGGLTTPQEVAAAGPWDAVWLCVSATALRGAWLEPLLAAVGDATVVLLTPGLEDRRYVLDALEAAGSSPQVRRPLRDSALEPPLGRRRAARPATGMVARRDGATPPRPAADLPAPHGDVAPPAPRSSNQAAGWGSRARAEARLVQGVITLIAFHAPLDAGSGDGLGAQEPGVAYWFPPGAKLPLAGEPARVAPLVRVLGRGGCRARRDPEAARSGALASAVMMPYLAALELAGWRFAAVRRSARLLGAWRAGREALAVVAAETGATPPWTARLLRPWIVRWLSRLAPLLFPFDIEAFLRVHFTKVGDQTRFMLGRYAALAAQRGLPHAHLDALTADLPPAGWAA